MLKSLIYYDGNFLLRLFVKGLRNKVLCGVTLIFLPRASEIMYLISFYTSFNKLKTAKAITVIKFIKETMKAFFGYDFN